MNEILSGKKWSRDRAICKQKGCSWKIFEVFKLNRIKLFVNYQIYPQKSIKLKIKNLKNHIFFYGLVWFSVIDIKTEPNHKL